MSAAMEDFARPYVDGSVALRTEGDTDAGLGCAGFGALLTHEDGVIDVADLERHVDQSFGVTHLVMVLVQLIGGEGDERQVVLGVDTHLTIEGIAGKTNAVLGILVKDRIVDGIFLHARA